MKFIVRAVVASLVLLGSIATHAGKIVYPWRATTAIVKQGETFKVWLDADNGQSVNSVELHGPFSTINVSHATENGSWVYDEWSGNTYNQILTVSVPASTPADRYDLVLKTSTGDEISLASVSVITEYRSKFYLFHMSDFHRWQSTYDTEGVILHEQSAMVDIANILNPAMVIETGDNIYPNSNVMTGSNVKSTESRVNQYYNGDETYLGINDFYAPVFSIPGNHDTPTKSFHTEPGYDANDLDGPWLAGPAQYWNDFFGLQNHNFTYGDARFIGVNNGWCPDTGGGAADYVPNYKWQLDQANAWLEEVGAGTVQVAYQHVPQESIPPIYKALEYGAVGVIPEVMLAGHIHNAALNPFIKWDTKVYCTYTPRDGSRKVPFNLFQVDTVAGTVTAVGNTRAELQGITTRGDYSSKKLRLSYAQANDGSQQSNTATLANDFSFPIEDARVRFVMAQDVVYSISQGQVQQAFDGDSVHVVDVLVDLPANSSLEVSIGEMGSSPNQAQFVSWNVPSQLNLGETVAVEVTMKNVGQDAWTTGAGQVLGSTDATWGLNRVALPVSTVPTNQTTTFSFNITAPSSPGGYAFQWRMIDEAGDNLGWFGSLTPSATITVGDTSPVVSFIEPAGDVSLDVGDDLYVNVGAIDPNGGSIRVRLYLDGNELSRSEGLPPYTWNGVDQSDPELLNFQAGTYVLKAKATDDQNESSEVSITITVGGDEEPVEGGGVVLAVDLHQNATDSVPTTPDYFSAWFVGNVSAGNAAPSTTIGGYGLTLGSGTTVDCLANAANHTGLNARNRSTGYIVNSGAFTQADMMRERIGSLANPTDSTAGQGTGNGLYLKISGLEADTSYLIQAWGVDSTGTFDSSNVRLKNGYCYGFDATAETAGYSSLPRIGSYTVSGSPTTIADNDQYSVSGVITSDSTGTLIYKQISNIDRSVMNGFVLFTAGAPSSGYLTWAAENGITGQPLDDDNGNGWNNLLEYALNGGVSPSLEPTESTPVFCHLRRNDDAELSYVVEVCTNLLDGSWSTNGVTVQGAGDAGGSFEEVTNAVPDSSEAVYVRLKVELAE